MSRCTPFWSRGHASVGGACCWGPPDETGCLLSYRQLMSGCRRVRYPLISDTLSLSHDVRSLLIKRRLICALIKRRTLWFVSIQRNNIRIWYALSLADAYAAYAVHVRLTCTLVCNARYIHLNSMHIQPYRNSYLNEAFLTKLFERAAQPWKWTCRKQRNGPQKKCGAEQKICRPLSACMIRYSRFMGSPWIEHGTFRSSV